MAKDIIPTYSLKEDIRDIDSSIFKHYSTHEGEKNTTVIGKLSVIDSNHCLWDSFLIKIEITQPYPYVFPTLFEIGGHIPKIEDRHINEDGSCCTCPEPEYLIACKYGIRIDTFLSEYALPFFANQVFFEQEGYFPSEYSHGEMGIFEFF